MGDTAKPLIHESGQPEFHVPVTCCRMELPARCGYLPVLPPSIRRKVLAEYIGTFMLIFAATASGIMNKKTGGGVGMVGLAATSGLACMIIIMTMGHISGAHLNPVVTFAFAAFGHFPWSQVPIYIVTQVVASISASFTLKSIFDDGDVDGGITIPLGGHFQSFIIEFIVTFNLMFVNTTVTAEPQLLGQLAAIAVGATITMNTLIASGISGASMNPARTLGPAMAANKYEGLWIYLVGPMLGALAGALAYSIVHPPKVGDEATGEGSSSSVSLCTAPF